MVLLKQGDESGGKMLLTKALKYAHNQLGNHQFVSQVTPLPLATCHHCKASSRWVHVDDACMSYICWSIS